jgi:hypothetical protein
MVGHQLLLRAVTCTAVVEAHVGRLQPLYEVDPAKSIFDVSVCLLIATAPVKGQVFEHRLVRVEAEFITPCATGELLGFDEQS